MPLEIQDLHRLRAAHGYADLGMYGDANAELEGIDPECSELPEVLAVRVGILGGMKDWESMLAVAKRLLEIDPANPQWPISLAYATRRARSIENAKVILLEALKMHPEEVMVRYNLACYECQLGNLQPAKEYLAKACSMEPKCRPLAREDADLEPLWSYLA